MGSRWRECAYGKMPPEWSLVRLKDLCVQPGGVQTGPFGSQLHQKDYQDFGTPIITVEHLGDNRILHRDLPRVSDRDLRRLDRYTLRTGDIVFSRVGSVDRQALVRDSENGWLFSGRCLRIRPDTTRVDPVYLSWFFGMPAFKEYIRRIAVGATMPSLNTELLSSVQVIVPPLREQRAIAAILGALDDKIELNRLMNKTLEAIVQAIFKSWFVDFDPVRAKAEGRQPEGLTSDIADLFPDGFQDSELGTVPQGWNMGTLGRVAHSERRAVDPSEVDPDTPYIGLEHMPRRCIALCEWGRVTDVTSMKLRFLRGEILFGKLRPYFHKVGIAPMDGVCSSDIIIIVSDPQWWGFVLGHVNSDSFINYTDAVSIGTKMPRVSWDDMARYDVVLPPAVVAQRFADIVSPMVERLRSNIIQSRTLALIRDALLPKLLSGEIRVKDGEKLAEVTV